MASSLDGPRCGGEETGSAPLRRAKAERLLRRLLIYILIGHQSQPDRLMPLRSLDYAVQIFRYQVREWSKTHRSFSRIRFDPVLPVCAEKTPVPFSGPRP